MRFRIFYIIVLLCSLHVVFGMEQQVKPGFFNHIRQHIYSAGNLVSKCASLAKKAVLTGIRWSWKKKYDFALQVGAEYFFPTDEIVQGKKTIAKRILQGAQMLQGYDNCGSMRAAYVNDQDHLGVARRCYAEKEPERFELFTKRVEEDPDNLDPRLINEFRPVYLDGKRYYRAIKEEVCSDLLLFIAAKVLFNKIKLPSNSIPAFYKHIAGRFGNIIMHDIILYGLVRPCLRFGKRVRQDGFQNAFRSLWHRNQPIVLAPPAI